MLAEPQYLRKFHNPSFYYHVTLYRVHTGHGKAICFQKIKRQKNKKFENITNKSEAGFISVEIKTSSYFMHVLSNYCFDTTVRTNALSVCTANGGFIVMAAL